MKFAVILFINFILSIVVTTLFVDAEEVKTKAYKTEAANNVLRVVADSIENMRSKLATLDYFVQHNGFDVDDFIAIAKTMMVDEYSKSNLQLAPKGVVTAIYPNELNSAAYINLLTDPHRKEAALNAIKVNQCYSQGPINLFQGGQGVIIRCPVFRDADGKRVFSGFVNSLINLDEVLANIDFAHLIDSRYDYSLEVINANGTRFTVIDQSTQTTYNFGVSASNIILGKQWLMTIYPVTSWISQQYLYFMVLSCILYNLIAFAIVWFLIRLNHHKQSSHLDYLTQTYNKKYLQEYLVRLIRKRQDFYLFYIDINDFKPINDNYGHDVGDKLLIEFSQRLIKHVCSTNTRLFRVGGDEFNLVVIKEGMPDIDYIIERMLYVCNQEYLIDSLLIKSTISFGYAVYPEESYDIKSLMKLADERMYHCKHQHKYDAQDFQI